MIHGRMLKISALLAFILSAYNANALQQEAVPGEFIVKIKQQSSFNAMAVSPQTVKVFNAESIRTVSKENKLILVKRNMLEKSDYAIQQINNVPGVEYVDPNYIYHVNKTPNDPKLEDLWGLKNLAQKGGREGIDIGAEAAWDIETGSQNVIVAVIDTGVDYNHPDLKGNIWTNEAELNGKPEVDDDNNGFIDDIYGYDFANNDADPLDDHGHGTHVSGTIGAKGDDGQGIVGVNWNVRIMGVKFLSGEGSGTLEAAIKAIDYATSMGAQIESNSWGGGGYTESLKEAIVRAEQKNVLFVAAAGNESNNNDTAPSYPATYDLPNVLSVAAVDNSGNLAYFSNYGKATVHVAAPGVGITSSVPATTNPLMYETWSGTSMATPHVSGIAALLLAHEPTLTYADIKSRIINSSRTLGSLRNKVAAKGIANAYYALTSTVAPMDPDDPYNWTTQEYALSSTHPYADKSDFTMQVSVPGAKKFSIFFSKFETEKGYDNVEFVDAQGNVITKWSGSHSEEFSPTFTGDSITLHFVADDSVSGYGFDISKVAVQE
ncbi:MAG: S8 family serine peptidase [Bdellovibrionales bacterium]